MKTHSQEIKDKIWRVWVTDDDLVTYEAEMAGEANGAKGPTHYEILGLYEALPTLFKVSV